MYVSVKMQILMKKRKKNCKRIFDLYSTRIPTDSKTDFFIVVLYIIKQNKNNEETDKKNSK